MNTIAKIAATSIDNGHHNIKFYRKSRLKRISNMKYYWTNAFVIGLPAVVSKLAECLESSKFKHVLCRFFNVALAQNGSPIAIARPFFSFLGDVVCVRIVGSVFQFETTPNFVSEQFQQHSMNNQKIQYMYETKKNKQTNETE